MDELLKTLLALLDEPGVQVRIIEIHLRQKKNAEPQPTPTKTRLRALTPLEERIIRSASREWQTATQLAAKCHMGETAKLRYALKSLADRGYLEASGVGYRLAPGVDVDELLSDES